jgi:hypothetical protein
LGSLAASRAPCCFSSEACSAVPLEAMPLQCGVSGGGGCSQATLKGAGGCGCGRGLCWRPSHPQTCLVALAAWHSEAGMRGDQPELGIGRTEGARRQAVPGNALETRAEKGGPGTRSDRSRATEGGWIRRSLDGSKCLHGLDRRHKLIPVSPGPDGCSPWPVALRSHTHTHTHCSTANRRAPMFILVSTRPAVWEVAFTSPGPPDPLGLATHSPALLSAAACCRQPGALALQSAGPTPHSGCLLAPASMPASLSHVNTAKWHSVWPPPWHKGTVAPWHRAHSNASYEPCLQFVR